MVLMPLPGRPWRGPPPCSCGGYRVEGGAAWELRRVTSDGKTRMVAVAAGMGTLQASLSPVIAELSSGTQGAMLSFPIGASTCVMNFRAQVSISIEDNSCSLRVGGASFPFLITIVVAFCVVRQCLQQRAKRDDASDGRSSAPSTGGSAQEDGTGPPAAADGATKGDGRSGAEADGDRHNTAVALFCCCFCLLSAGFIAGVPAIIASVHDVSYADTWRGVGFGLLSILGLAAVSWCGLSVASQKPITYDVMVSRNGGPFKFSHQETSCPCLWGTAIIVAGFSVFGFLMSVCVA